MNIRLARRPRERPDALPHRPRTSLADGSLPRAALRDDSTWDRSPETLRRAAAALRAPEVTHEPLPALARAYVPAPPGQVLPPVPLTLPPVIYDDLGGDEWCARSCHYCYGLQGRGDLSWRDDAFGRSSCPPCQMRPDWRSPLLPGIPGGPYEMGIIARSLLGTDPRSVRQRPDGKWTAAILIEGRRKVLGAFGSKEEAETVYGAILDAFAAAAAERRAA